MHIVHKKRQKTKLYLYIVAAIVITVIVNPFNILGPVRSFMVTALTPVRNIGQAIGMSVETSFSVITDIGNIYQKNQELEGSNRELRAEIAQLTDIKNENDALREQIDLLPRGEFDLTTAEVVARDSIGGYHWVMVNKGSKDGIDLNMAVITDAKVFVGFIDQVDHGISRVRLVTHPESTITVANAKNGAEAIARGRHGLSIEVQDIKKGDVVNNGDMFITSQVGNRFPRGLSIGNAQNVTLSDDGLFQSANIIPIVDLGELRFISIIKEKK